MRFQAWINRRIRPAKRVELNRNNLFIFPSRGGLGFLCLLILLWVMGTNYENTLILALTFLLLSVMVVAILQTYDNLAGLYLEVVEVAPVFCGEQVAFTLLLRTAKGRIKAQQLRLNWRHQPVQLVASVKGELLIAVPATSIARGWLSPGRLKLESDFPLGIIRCWTWLDLDCKALVYPQPVASDEAPWQAAEGEMDEHFKGHGSEDFVGITDYQQGQSMARISWKHYARGQGILMKQFADPQGQAQALDWEFFDGMPTEARLSRLCYWVLHLHQRGLPFSLSLPSQQIAMGEGDAQRDSCLTALALHGKRELA